MTPTQVKAKIWMSAAKGAVLPFATLMVVLFMMVPVPAVMLDIGFITNIMISLAVLMVALNAAKPLDFSSFPTVRCGPSLFEKRRNSSILGEFLRYACNSCKNMSKYPSQKQKNNWGGQSYGG